MLTVAVPKRNKLPNIIVLTPKDGTSAKTGAWLLELQETIEAVLREQKVFIERIYPYSDAAKIQLIRKYGELETEEYREDGIFVRAYVPAQVYAKVSEPM